MVIRKDKLKNKAKVAKALIKEPLLTDREIENKTGVSKSSSNRARNELGQDGTKDDRIIGLTDKDFGCISLGVKEIKRRLGSKKELEKMRTSEISQVIRENTARYTLFRGDATGGDGGVKQPNVTFQIMNPNEGEDN